MTNQHLHYGFWAEWTNPQKVTFDGPNKLIHVNAGITEIDVEIDLYSDWKEWFQLYDHGKYLPAFRSVGGDPTTAGRALGATFFLINGWRIRTWEGDHRLVVNGNLFTEEGEPPFIPVTGPYTTIIESNVSNLVDRLTTLDRLATIPDETWMDAEFTQLASQISSLPTAAQVATEVWSTPEATKMLLAAKILQNKTITNPNTGQMIVFDDDGITPLLVAALYEDIDAVQPYQGQGAERRERLE